MLSPSSDEVLEQNDTVRPAAIPRTGRTAVLLSHIRSGKALSSRQQIWLTFALALPAILAQLSTLAMNYIDAAMVGSLGAVASASIGLMGTSVWLFTGLATAAATGFYVQIAHRTGAADATGGQSVARTGLVTIAVLGCLLSAIALGVSGALPNWLGSPAGTSKLATVYFAIFATSLPFLALQALAGGMLRCSGNMLVPSLANVGMCMLDVLLNAALIFPSREVAFGGCKFVLLGAGLGVAGAALATAIATAATAAFLWWYVAKRTPLLRQTGSTNVSAAPTLPSKRGALTPGTEIRREIMGKAAKIALPIGTQHAAICGAQIMITTLVAPLGNVAIAANTFALIAESLCYMPGYGFAESATALVGQCLGARRFDLLRRFAIVNIVSAMTLMTLLAVLMYVFANEILQFLSPVAAISQLGAEVLRIEAFAEPMFAAALVCFGIFVGMGRTFWPCVVKLACIWGIRFALASILVPTMGLRGIWIAMALELSIRGAIFLLSFCLWRVPKS